MHLSFQALVLAALSLEGALAQPAHRHQHKHRRDLADVLGQKLDLSKRVNFNDKKLYNGVPWEQICANGGCDGKSGKQVAPGPVATSSAGASPAETGSTAPPDTKSQAPPSSTSSSAPSSSPSTSNSDSSGSSGSSSGSGTGTGSCAYPSAVWDKSKKDTSMSKIGGVTKCPGGCTSADGEKFSNFDGPTKSKKRATVAEDTYQGNVGSTYGHNMYPLESCDVSSQKYSITFYNADSNAIEVAMWNKVGDDYNTPGNIGPITGAFRNAFWKFPLGPGQSAAFAVQKNSQIAFSQACDRSFSGGHDCTWGEADFGNESNKGYSGYDRSSIPNSKGNEGLLTVCVDGHDCSSKDTHSFVSASQTDAGGSLTVPPEQPMHLKVTMG